jgi:cytochrome c biogenesis protein CcmG, thiol:disulfide interchange protein DsbE
MKPKLVLIIGLLLILAAGAIAQEVQTKRIPDFTLTDIEGRTFNLSKNLSHGPVYVSFWATWCKPCIEELKIIQKLYAKYADQGFQVVAINTEGPKASVKVKSFVKSSGFTFRVLLDNDGEVFRRKFKGAAMPFTFLADAQGNVVFSAVGFKPGDEVEIEKKIVENLIIPPDTTDADSPDSTGRTGQDKTDQSGTE